MYSDKLIKEVKEVYPDSKKMHILAESGNVFLGRYLDDSSQNGISIDEILLATSLNELQEKARMYKRRINLYKMWCDEDPRVR